jgi:hypothetical protein
MAGEQEKGEGLGNAGYTQDETAEWLELTSRPMELEKCEVNHD